MFIAAYDKHGSLLWRDQIGTGVEDLATDIRVGDNNDVYLCGNTVGGLAGKNDGQWVLMWQDTNAPENISGNTSTVRLRIVSGVWR